MRMLKYRYDIKGEVRAVIQEFKDSLRVEILNAECFTFGVEETEAWKEYSNYLTDAEMRKAASSIR